MGGYTEPLSSGELTALIGADLGWRLPAFYVALMRMRNEGGDNTCFPAAEATS